MSLIYTDWYCSNCHQHTERYVSFGDPWLIDKTFNYHWICPSCGHENVLTIYSLEDSLNLYSGQNFGYTIDGWNNYVENDDKIDKWGRNNYDRKCNLI